MNDFKKMIPYASTAAAAYYFFPLLGNSTGSFILILLVVIPVSCFAISYVYGLKNGWNLFFPIITGILFIPAIFIFYNSSAWVYIVGYSIISAAGVLTGKLSRKV